MGQTADSELVVRGDKQSRHVALYSSRPWELSVGVRAVALGAALAAAAPPCWLRRVCSDATRCRVRQFEHAGGFGLVAGAVNRMAVRLRPLSSGVQHTIVNLVDADDRRLVACWRVCVSTEPPVVTRAYDIALRVGTGVNKVCQHGCGARRCAACCSHARVRSVRAQKIAYENPWDKSQPFTVRSSNPALCHVKQSRLVVAVSDACHCCSPPAVPVFSQSRCWSCA
jgi:hypothetical protein